MKKSNMRITAALAALLLAAGSAIVGARIVGAWPNGPDEDPLLDPPNDPGFVQFNEEGQVVDGDWNLWSFTPERWADNPNFRQEEVAMGTGIHADRAWQRTIGRSEVIIAVLDSGVRWGQTDLINKYYLNRAELDSPEMRPRTPEGFEGDPFDVNGDGIFNIKDYAHFFPEEELARLDAAPGNQNGRIDPQDLIRRFSDGVDGDANGYIDDISGWDFFWNDNDPHDDTDFGHGDGEARDSAAEGNDGQGGIGVCPTCLVLMCRAADSFVADANEFGASVIFAVDSGASLIQEALGSINNTTFSQKAIEYAYQNNVAVVASAADELSFHHNFPGTNNHTIYVHAVVHDSAREDSTTFLNYNNCTNHGAQLLLSTPGGGCSSEAVGKTSGHVGLVYSAALDAEISPPLSAEEVRGLLIMSADDIDVEESRDTSRVGLPCTQADANTVCGTDGLFRCFLPPNNRDDPSAPPVGECFNTKFPSTDGWDFHFGYGRNNARGSVDMIFEGMIPPEVDITGPLWFETVDPLKTPTLDIVGRIGRRVDGLAPRYTSYDYVAEYALGVDPKGGWIEIAAGTTEGIDGTLASLDLSTLPEVFDYKNRPVDPHEDAITLRVRVTAVGAIGPVHSEFRKAAFVHHDDTLMPGFPIFLGASGESSPKLFDFDGDKKDELVIVSADGIVHAFKADATEMAGFPIRLGLRPGQDDDKPNSHRSACSFRQDKAGCRAQRFTLDPDVAQTLIATPAIGDLDNDGDAEIVVSSFDGEVFAFHHDGKLVAGFPVEMDAQHSALARSPDISVAGRNVMEQGFFGSPVLYDLDGDGDLEIVQAGMDQHLYVWNHDGAQQEGFPVLCRDAEEEGGGVGARIIVTPAIGDLDLDGEPEIVLGTNEVYNESETRIYIVKARGNADPDGPFELGGPQFNFGLIGEILPMVGTGEPANPAIADVDFDGRPEFAMEAIAGQPIMLQLNIERSPSALIPISRMDNVLFGARSNSLDSPAYPLVNNGSFGRLDPSGDLAYVKGTAGFNFAFAFAEGGTRLIFDHQISAWNANPASRTPSGQPFIEGFPQKVEDWQFFMNPALADLTGDGLSEVILGSGGYLVRAIDYKGDEAPGFPKFTGGWIIASPAVGDMDGDGKFDVVTSTRNGWLYAWKTEAAATNRLDWQSFGHDPANTNNHGTPLKKYGDGPGPDEDPVCGNGALEDGEVCDGDELGGQTCQSQGFASGELACVDCALDTSACAEDQVNPPNPADDNDDSGCCAVPSSDPARTPWMPIALAALGLALLATTRRR